MIRVENLSIAFPPAVRALNSVDLEFKRGSFVVLLGRSGAGKTTLLRAIAHLIPPTQGRILIDGFGTPGSNGVDGISGVSGGVGALLTREDRRNWQRQTAFIFQLHQLILRQSALRNVLLGRLGYLSTLRSLLPFSRSDERLALHCLDRVGLLEKALTRADQLSGGQRQRVGIARALCQQATLILADEPVASLDPVTAREVLNLLNAIRRDDGLTVIVSLHQVDLAREFGEHIVGMHGGKVVFEGKPEDLDDESLTRIYPEGTANAGPQMVIQRPAPVIFGCSGAVRHPEG
jgi:phosphonate transport system ATP-binding protein